jgi:hypothetical protein
LVIVELIVLLVCLLLLGLGAWFFGRRPGPTAAAVLADDEVIEEELIEEELIEEEVVVEEVVEEAIEEPPPTMITFACSGCGKTIKVAPELEGKKGKCKHCGQAIVVPSAGAIKATRLSP